LQPACTPMIGGVCTGEDGWFIMVDSDGSREGVVVAEGQIRYCCRQKEAKLCLIAGCGRSPSSREAGGVACPTRRSARDRDRRLTAFRVHGSGRES
jgi:hypothetical protein